MGHPKNQTFREEEPLWRRILLALLSVLVLVVLLLIACVMFLLYFDGPR